MNKKAQSIGQLFMFVAAFILIGTGIGILYESNGDIVSVVGGFALIGIGLAVLKKVI